MIHIASVGGLNVSTFTDAKLIVKQSIEINALPEKIWGIISDQSLASEWLPSVKKLESFDVSKANVNGVGTERIVVYGSGDKIKETVVYAERNKILAYQASFPSMVKDHLSIIEITGNDFNMSTLHFYAYFTPIHWSGYLMKFGVYGNIIKSSLKKLNGLCSS